MASHPIYQFYAELDGFKPKIWRRFQVVDNITVARLGYIVQVLFEMTASHLMAIEVPRGSNIRAVWQQLHPNRTEELPHSMFPIENFILRYEIINESFEPIDVPNKKQADAVTTRLRHAVECIGDRLNVNYDFGNDWWVSLTLEEVFTDKELPGGELPRVLEGSGFGIVEDCGGISGLQDLANAFKKKKGIDYKRFSQWLGIDNFDITAFDLDDMNFRIKKIPRIYKQAYEDRLRPTQKSLDLIERKYLRKKS